MMKNASTSLTAFLSDAFNRANAALTGSSMDVGGTWSGPATGGVSLSITSNAVVGLSDGSQGSNLSAATGRTNCTAQVRLVALGGSGNRIRLVMRSGGGSGAGRFDGYHFVFNTNSGPTYTIQSWSAGASATVSSATGMDLAAGDILKAKVAGTALTMSVLRGTTETILVSATDSTWTTQDRYGLAHESGSLNAGPTLDDFQVAA